ncbi:MAG: archaemetzincin [Myxococcota bacterium]|nr:archaemetzincin [Myxococcota bacterium]
MQENDVLEQPSWFQRHFDSPRVRLLRRLAIFVAAGAVFYITLIKPAYQLRKLATLRVEASDFARGTPHEAVGELDAIDKNHRWAFAPYEGYAPMPEPREGDWAHQFQERAQTFDDYLSDGPNMVTPERAVLYLQVTGDFDPARAPELEVMRQFIEIYFQMETRLRPKMKGYTAKSRTIERTGKKQILVTDLLAAMKKDVPEDAYAVLALSTTDLYPDESWGYVFGMASFKDRVGVYSVARFHEDFRTDGANTPPEVLLRRTLATMAHETGHMFSISHCQHFACLLNGSNSLQESDRGPLHLCPVCLRKLYHAKGGFDPEKRYRELRDFYVRHNLTEQARWATSRHDAIPK